MSDLTQDLAQALAALWERAQEVSGDVESDLFGESCPCCDGALPMAHSLGCQVRNALHRAKKETVEEEHVEEEHCPGCGSEDLRPNPKAPNEEMCWDCGVAQPEGSR